MATTREFDAPVLARYGILSPAIQAKGDRQGIVVATAPVSSLDDDDLHGLLELACMMRGTRVRSERKHLAYRKAYLKMMERTNATSHRNRRCA